MTRDIRQEPQPGDVVQVYPPFGRTPPLPLTILAITDRGVRWYRDGQGECLTGWRTWQGVGDRSPHGPPPVLELIDTAVPA